VREVQKYSAALPHAQLPKIEEIEANKILATLTVVVVAKAVEDLRGPWIRGTPYDFQFSGNSAKFLVRTRPILINISKNFFLKKPLIPLMF
jgi:hypothetical protein